MSNFAVSFRANKYFEDNSIEASTHANREIIKNNIDKFSALNFSKY